MDAMYTTQGALRHARAGVRHGLTSSIALIIGVSRIYIFYYFVFCSVYCEGFGLGRLSSEMAAGIL